MAQPTNAHSSYDAVGNREDLADVIHRITPTRTPFSTMAGKKDADGVLHEWQTQALAAVDTTNFVIEGDDATNDAATPTVRLGNRCNISDKVAVVTGTQEVVDKAGRGSEMDYQMVLKGLELKRDQENILLQNNARVVGNDTTARECAGYLAWMATNTSRGAGGANPTGDGTDAATNGTQRVFTELLLKAVLKLCYDSGGSPDTCMLGSFNKQQASSFSGGSTRMDKSEDKTVTAAVDHYKSDFGDIDIVPNLFCSTRDAYIQDFEHIKIPFLRAFVSHDLAKSGDSMKKQILSEYTLELHPGASGVVADLTTS